MDGRSTVVSLRMPIDVRNRLDAHASKMTQERIGRVTRSALIVRACRRLLVELDDDRSKKVKK